TRKKNKRGKQKRKTYYVGIDRQFSPVPRYITRLEADIERPKPANLFVRGQHWELEDEEDVFIPITERNHVLQNVTVKAKRRYFTNDDWKYKNEAWGKQYAALYYDIDREVDKYRDRGEPVPSPLEFLDEKTHMDLSKYAHLDLLEKRATAFIYDNGEREYTALAIKEDRLEEIKSIYVVFDERISPMLGRFDLITSPQPYKHVYIYYHHTYTTESQKGLRRTYFQGFNKPSTFQMEDYSVIPPMADFRRTIYWNPDVKTDAQGKAKVEFFNNSTCQEMYISAEGMTADGKVLVNE
ncbi:MAG: hypothetical protein IKD25_04360, partial [Bacteroidaceae bacterium]|nr:hypothetical protein [Bacteroidaceae bacterium]